MFQILYEKAVSDATNLFIAQGELKDEKRLWLLYDNLQTYKRIYFREDFFFNNPLYIILKFDVLKTKYILSRFSLCLSSLS